MDAVGDLAAADVAGGQQLLPREVQRAVEPVEVEGLTAQGVLQTGMAEALGHLVGEGRQQLPSASGARREIRYRQLQPADGWSPW